MRWHGAVAVAATFVLVFGLFVGVSGCGSKTREQISDRPDHNSNDVSASVENAIDTVRMYFVPSGDVGKILTNADPLAKALEQMTGYKFETACPPSYAAVIEALGAKPPKADMAWLPTFAYVMAHDKYGVEVALQIGRYGEVEYKGMFIARADSGINSLEDIQGKTLVYPDAASTSGFVYPMAQLAALGIEPAKTAPAGGHGAVVLAVYSGRADVGCAYYSPPGEDGAPRDARKDVRDQ